MAKKPKQRSYTPVAGRYPGGRDEHEPPASVEQPKRNLLPPNEEFYKFSPRSAGRLKKPNSMAGESPLIQISDLLRNFPQVPHTTAYLHPIEIHPKPEDTFSFNQRIELAAKEDANSSPSNRPKEYEASTNHLLPKGKDMSPTRKKENEFLQSPSSLADRIMEEINQKIKADKAEKQYIHHIDVSSPAVRGKEHSAEKGTYNTYGDLSEHMKDLNRTPPVSEFKYYESKTVSTRPLSIDRHMAEISKDMSNISSMSPSSKKPPVLPGDLKTKFNNYNKVIDKHNFEFNQVISTHIVKEDQAVETVKALKPVTLAPYASMIEKKDQKEGFATNIGATMQMDS